MSAVSAAIAADIYLVGAPNTGKSTLFAALCGKYAKAGNREGVTVEAKIAAVQLAERSKSDVRKKKFKLCDLPGIRTVPPSVPDEKLSMSALAQANTGSVVVFVADAAHLAEGLQLLEDMRAYLDNVWGKRQNSSVKAKNTAFVPPTFVLAVNGCDKLQPSAPHLPPQAAPAATDAAAVDAVLDQAHLAQLIGLPVVGISARKRWGISELRKVLMDILNHPLPQDSRFSTHSARSRIAGDGSPCAACAACAACSACNCGHDITPYAEVASQVLRARLPPLSRRRQALDASLTHGPVGVAVLALIFIALMAIVFGPPGNFLCRLVDGAWTPLLALLTRYLSSAPAAVVSLVCEGLVGGVGAVLSFLPRLALLWLGVALLEDVGYLPRAARLSHPFMQKIGLSGEALIPLLLGFGCSVPAVMTARTVADPRVRQRTIGLMPLVTCSARMPLFSLLAEAFYPNHSRPYLSLLFCAGLYLLSFALTLLVAALDTFIRRSRQRSPSNADAPSQPERSLPPLKWPSPGAILAETCERIVSFLGRVGGVILLTSLLAWLLLHTTVHFSWTAEPDERCLLFCLGRLLSPLLSPLGLSHPALAAALIAGVGAKESIVSVLAVCLSCAGIRGTAPAASVLPVASIAPAALPSALAASGWLNPRTALVLAVFSAFYLPCTAALGTMAAEWPGRRRHLAYAILRSLSIAWLLGWGIFVI